MCGCTIRLKCCMDARDRFEKANSNHPVCFKMQAPPSPPPVPADCLVDRAKAPTGGLKQLCAVFGDPHGA